MRVLRLGDQGADVGLLQQRLKRQGYAANDTHVFDDTTQTNVRTLQRKFGLVDDGIAGPKTYDALLKGWRDPKHLSDADLAKAADALGVPLACMRAVNEVESAGLGFLPSGRPKILFERHVFRDRLRSAGLDVASLEARYPAIVSRQRGGYQGGEAEHVRLSAAENIQAAIAWESTSWGAFQIMGYHAVRLGYDDIDSFVDLMERSEADQMDAFVRFIRADTALLAALKGKKWAAFAKGYNGPDYAANLYDKKLALAYDKYSVWAAPKAAA